MSNRENAKKNLSAQQVSMITVRRMAMIGKAAKFVIKKMGQNNQEYSRYQKPIFKTTKKLFKNQEYYAKQENKKRKPPMMVAAKTVKKRITADAKCEEDHKAFEQFIIDNVYPK
jgi:hypothetical protein